MDAIIKILSKCSSPGTNISPTLLYNEGWMVRLLTEISVETRLKLPEIDFGNFRHWYSEGLLSSPFLPRYRGDDLAEGFTHTDVALGDFSVFAENRGDITLPENGEYFGVIEAKMGSPLSSGTKNAPDYDQASRNLACIAYNTLRTQHAISFFVVAPQVKIDEYRLDEQVRLPVLLSKIEQRFESYKDDDKIYLLKDSVLQRANTCTTLAISYETWIDALDGNIAHSFLSDFLKLCYKFNRLS